MTGAWLADAIRDLGLAHEEVDTELELDADLEMNNHQSPTDVEGVT